MRIAPLAAAATALAAAGTLVMVQAPAASGAAACTVVWSANQWSTGFTADVRVTNNGPRVDAWALTWTFAGDQRVTSGWNAQVTQSGRAVTARSTAWNGSLGAGATTAFGFQATHAGTTPAPADFAFNGASCTDTGQPSPPPGSTPPSSTPPSSTPPPSSAPPSPTLPPPPGCGSAGVCDGFEDQTGSTPSGAWSVVTPDCAGAGTATVDRTVAHSGSTSIRIDGAAGYCNHVFVRSATVGAAGTPLYVRYWVRHTTALPAAHVTTVALQDAADGGRDLRLGGQNGALQWNRASDDATLPEQSPAGVAQSAPLPTDAWTCVEFMVDGADGTMQTWLNGVSVPGLRQDGVPTHDIDGQWLNRTYRPRLTDLKLGWESYGEGADTLWYDDVSVGNTRRHC